MGHIKSFPNLKQYTDYELLGNFSDLFYLDLNDLNLYIKNRDSILKKIDRDIIELNLKLYSEKIESNWAKLIIKTGIEPAEYDICKLKLSISENSKNGDLIYQFENPTKINPNCKWHIKEGNKARIFKLDSNCGKLKIERIENLEFKKYHNLQIDLRLKNKILTRYLITIVNNSIKKDNNICIIKPNKQTIRLLIRNSGKNKQLSILNTDGNAVYFNTIKENSITIKNNFPKGIYFLVFKSRWECEIKKFQI
ncbi:MAG: T9SS type A sorting domain-containing protein [Marinifilaceae bacterium]|jgi:uncharacterized ubiquitin-like protein YukD|nr:T9SS type A sorting domain-containing protein [Marinifilaceae bacterium]